MKANAILGLCCLCLSSRHLLASGVAVQTITVVEPPADWRNESATEDGGRVCGSLDIRNTVRGLHQLRGCRVIEGYLRIQLFDNADEEDFEDITFPELMEITEYLLLFRVNGLKTLGDLFPNLSVIRGATLCVDYALVIYSMPLMEDIGLRSLSSITRGAVRIEDNAKLCFIDTVDWNALTVRGNEYIISNKAVKDCAGCDDDCASGLCWSKKDCQPVQQHTACHELCLGGCSGPGPFHCNACQTVRLHGECLRSCPTDRLNYLGRHCITEKQCRNMGRKLSEGGGEIQYWPFDNSCVRHCPRGFVEVRLGNDTTSGCKACGELCPCVAARVDSIAAAQNLTGCTHINGSIEIEIRGGKHIMQELEDGLGSIQEIYGNLKIVRSFPLVSLNFLKNLRVIKGIMSNYSLIIHNNQNLKELWDFNTKPNGVQIKNGRLFIHNNPKLCISGIERMNKLAGLGNFTKHEVSQESNGDKVSCNHLHANNLVVNVTIILSKSVVVEWEQVRLSKESLIRYIVYYIEAQHRNVTSYDERGACGGSDQYWRINYVDAPPDSNVNVHHPLTRLQPYTQYAYYVTVVTSQTYTIRQSQIQYFRTQPDRPSIPTIVKAIANKNHELVLQWEPPRQPNGILQLFLISGTVLKDDRAFLDQRDYCKHPMTVADEQTTDDALLSLKRRRKVLNCCGKEENFEIRDDLDFKTRCDNNENKSAWSKEEAQAQAEACKDYIHTYLSNHVPKKKDDDLGMFLKKYDKASAPKNEEEIWPPWGYVDPESATNDTDIKRNETFLIKVDANTTSLIVRNVLHFAKYSIKVMACRHAVDQDNTRCSFASLVTIRSRAMEVADEIRFIDVKIKTWNETIGQVQISWSHPKTPNGIIVSYNVEYRRANIQNSKLLVKCLTRRQHELSGGMYVVKNLSPGKYRFRIRAMSLAGEGPFTEMIDFYVTELLSPALLQEMIGAALGTVAILSCVAIIVIYCRSQLRKQLDIRGHDDCAVSSHYVEDHWELPRDEVQLDKELGQGSFGMVYEGVLKTGNTPCAIKKFKVNATYRERLEFLNEASVMKSLSEGHHVVKLLGVVSRGHPPLVVMELMASGDLKSYLRAMREGNNGPDLKQIFMMAAQIADGMAYLEARKFVHRDLAARNCMLGEDLTVKVGDFGMTRDIYEMDYYRNGDRGMLPVRWMAPESLADGVFSSQSDIWSYGVVIWEISTLAIQPYQGLSNEQVLLLVLGGGTLEQSKNCPDVLYALMEICWKWRPDTRPSFLQLVQRLASTSELGHQFQLLSFYHTQETSQVDIYPDIHTQQLVAHWRSGVPFAESDEESTEQQVALRLPPPPKIRRTGANKQVTYSNVP